MQGFGYFFTEEMTYNKATGELTTDGTWNYKPPCALDIPLTLNVTLLKNAKNPSGVLSSKATGEPHFSHR